jgi:hypothetical protein
MMYRYTIFDPSSGHSVGAVLAHNPALACAAHDQTIGEHNRKYDDIGSALFKGRAGYNVYSNGCFVTRVAITDNEG